MTTRAPLYPVGLVLEGRLCLVVGGGRVAARKVAGLLATGARVTVIAPEVVAAIGSTDGVTVLRRPYRRGDVEGFRLVVTATGDRRVDQAVFDDADAAGIWVNAADDPDRCSFTLPAVARRGSVTVAVATDGTSPALAGWLRDHLAAALPDDVEALAAAVSRLRSELQELGCSTEGFDWRELIDALATAAPR